MLNHLTGKSRGFSKQVIQRSSLNSVYFRPKKNHHWLCLNGHILAHPKHKQTLSGLN